MAKRSLFLLGIAAATAACSVLIDVDGKQCEVDADCAARGFNGAVCSENLCLTSIVGAGGAGAQGGTGAEAGQGGEGASSTDPLVCSEVPSSEPTVKFTFAPIFANPPAEPKPFTVKACIQLDIACENPVFGPLEVEAGVPQDFEVPRGFNGYFEIKNEVTLPSLFFMGRAINVDTVGWPVRVPDPSTVQLLGLAAQQEVDPALGIVLAVVRDCKQLPLPEMTFASSLGGDGFYIINDLPNTAIGKTGPQGAAGYVNVPLGTTVLTATTQDGQELKPVSVRLQAGYISFAEVFP